MSSEVLVKFCTDCGTEVLGRRKYCDLCMKNRRRKQIRDNVKRFNAKVKVPKTCICCGKDLPLWGKKYCYECAGISQRIISRHVMKDRLKSKERPEDYQRSIALSSVAVSDMIFKTDKCDQDCFNCKYDDCIL